MFTLVLQVPVSSGCSITIWGVVYESAVHPVVVANFLQEFSMDNNSLDLKDLVKVSQDFLTLVLQPHVLHVIRILRSAC